MTDPTTKVHRPQGGDVLAVESGGMINVKPGGVIAADGVQGDAIADVATGGSATAAANATAINAILDRLRGVGIIAES